MSADATPSSIKLPQALRQRVRDLAEARHQSAHTVMLQAIESYVEREEKREALRQEARAAHEYFMLTGLHLSGDEASAWLDKLADGHDLEPPACHTEMDC